MGALDRLITGILRAQPLGAPLEGRGVRRRPPVAQLALGVELAALVIEAVGELVAYHPADGAVVDRRVGGRVEHRRLQDARREHDVAQRAVVGVVGLGRHPPVRAVDRPLQAADVEAPIPRS